MDFALQQAKQYGNVIDIVIGDECIFGPNSASQLASLMGYAKIKRDELGLTIPITTRQIWGVMAGVNNMDPDFDSMREVLLDLVGMCDQYIYLDMYAYFDSGIAAAIGGQGASQAQFTAAVQSSMSAQWGALMKAWNAQKLTLGIRFGETGWPTAGVQSAQQTPWLANVPFAQWYYLAMKSWMAQNSVTGYIFEAYDESWKGDGSNSETHFGIWTASGTTSAPSQYTLTGVTQKYSIPGPAPVRPISDLVDQIYNQPSDSQPGIDFRSIFQPKMKGPLSKLNGAITQFNGDVKAYNLLPADQKPAAWAHHLQTKMVNLLHSSVRSRRMSLILSMTIRPVLTRL